MRQDQIFIHIHMFVARGLYIYTQVKTVYTELKFLQALNN